MGKLSHIRGGINILFITYIDMRDIRASTEDKRLKLLIFYTDRRNPCVRK